jgi:hypothetical protein
MHCNSSFAAIADSHTQTMPATTCHSVELSIVMPLLAAAKATATSRSLVSVR